MIENGANTSTIETNVVQNPILRGSYTGCSCYVPHGPACQRLLCRDTEEDGTGFCTSGCKHPLDFVHIHVETFLWDVI